MFASTFCAQSGIILYRHKKGGCFSAPRPLAMVFYSLPCKDNICCSRSLCALMAFLIFAVCSRSGLVSVARRRRTSASSISRARLSVSPWPYISVILSFTLWGKTWVSPVNSPIHSAAFISRIYGLSPAFRPLSISAVSWPLLALFALYSWHIARLRAFSARCASRFLCKGVYVFSAFCCPCARNTTQTEPKAASLQPKYLKA